MRQLTPRQDKFVSEYVLCGNASEAARRAGYSVKTARVIAQETLLNPAVAQAIRAQQAANAVELQITKQDVIAGMLCAIAIARGQQNPAAMIQGCAALAKLCGFYAPEVSRLEACDESMNLAARFVAMSDGELLAIARGGQASVLRN